MFRLESSGWIELSWCWTVYHVSRHCFHILSSYATLMKNHPSFISSLRSRLAIASRSDIPCPGGFECCASEAFNEWSNAWFGVQGRSHKTTQIAISAINLPYHFEPFTQFDLHTANLSCCLWLYMEQLSDFESVYLSDQRVPACQKPTHVH